MKTGAYGMWVGGGWFSYETEASKDLGFERNYVDVNSGYVYTLADGRRLCHQKSTRSNGTFTRGYHTRRAQ
eukprot:scaffold103254_cov77-Cyclotella_meneghiniana.AAC.3